MSTTVWNTGALAGGIVTAQCLFPSTTSTGASSIVAQTQTQVDAAGRWALELTPNTQVKPSGTVWQITEPTNAGDPSIWQVVVPAGASSSAIASWQVTRLPTAVSAGITSRPSITGSRGGATVAVLTSLLSALAAEGIIANNTTT